MRTFAQLLASAGWNYGNIVITDSANANRLTQLKFALNVIQEENNKHRDLRTLFTRQGKLLTVATYSTGTMAVTNNSKTITITTGVFNADFIGRVFVSDDNTNIRYRIKSVTSSSIALLESPYAGTTNATETFNIYKDRYYVGWDKIGIWNIVDRDNERRLFLEDLRGLSDPFIFDVEADDQPFAGAVILSFDTYYSTGTMSVTNGNTSITITTGTFISEMDGLPFRVDGDSEIYTLTFVNSSTATLDRAYTGTTDATASFEIAPPGEVQIEIYEMPNSQSQMSFDYLFRLPPLVNDNDISIITRLDDDVLWRGAVWYVKNDDEEQGANDAFSLYLRAQSKMVQGVGRILPETGKVAYRDI